MSEQTPGPFYLELDLSIKRKRSRKFSLAPAYVMDEAERQKVVGLLNKGLQFDRLLAAAKRLKECEDRWIAIGGDEALKELYSAIAKAEGR